MIRNSSRLPWAMERIRGGRSSLGGLALTVVLFGLSAALLSCNNASFGDDDGSVGDGGGDMGGSGSHTLVGVRIVPDNDVLLVDLNQTAMKSYHVLAVMGDGTKTDVTAQVMPSLDNPAIGTLAGSTFTSKQLPSNKVDFTHIKATYQGFNATANLTVVWLRMTGPSQDFFYTLPYQGSDQTQPLTFQTFIQSIDAFFAVDTTGSMGGEINNLKSSLVNTIIPAVKKAAVKDAWFGVGAVEDFGYGSYGQAGAYAGHTDDQPFILLSAMTSSVTTAQAAVGELLNGTRPRGNGNDLPEGQMEALYQIATGAGNQLAGVVNIPPHQVPGTGGGVEFRSGAFPIITLITDASFHAKGETTNCEGQAISYAAPVDGVAHTRSQTVDALKKVCAKVIGLAAEPGYPASCIPTADMTQMAQATNTLVPPEAWGAAGSRPSGCAVGQCCTGLNGVGAATDVNGQCPLVFKILTDGTGVGAQVVSGITNLALFSTFDVVTATSGTTTGEGGIMIATGHTSSDFIKSIVPLDAMASPPPTSKLPVKTAGGFTNVVPGAVVRFTIDAKNDFQMPSSMPQVFHATIKILAGGCTDLDQRDVIILVPPSAPPAIG